MTDKPLLLTYQPRVGTMAWLAQLDREIARALGGSIRMGPPRPVDLEAVRKAMERQFVQAVCLGAGAVFIGYDPGGESFVVREVATGRDDA